MSSLWLACLDHVTTNGQKLFWQLSQVYGHVYDWQIPAN